MVPAPRDRLIQLAVGEGRVPRGFARRYGGDAGSATAVVAAAVAVVATSAAAARMTARRSMLSPRRSGTHPVFVSRRRLAGSPPVPRTRVPISRTKTSVDTEKKKFPRPHSRPRTTPMGFIVIHTVYIAWAVLFFWVWYLRVPIGKGLRRVNRFSRGLIGR